MMTAEERIASLHARMAARRRWRERRTISRMYAACAALALCMTALIFDGAHPGGTAGVYTGAAMLFDGAGPYVLVAVIAFMLGVAVTVLLRRRLEKQRTKEENSVLTGGE